MSAPRAAQLLKTWERGLDLSPAQRTLTLLGATWRDATLDPLANLTIGELDRRLLNLREQTFGGRLNAITTCPACTEKLELSLDLADLCTKSPGELPASLTLEQSGYSVKFRLPNGSDLLALDQGTDITDDRVRLLRRCVLSARRETTEIPAGNLPDEIASAIATKMAEADPQADILISLQCPQCGHRWHAPLDISSFFWSELNSWATQLLRDIHVFASAYGWNETDILALSPTRRRLYLEMIGK
jgi:hypothetical protein